MHIRIGAVLLLAVVSACTAGARPAAADGHVVIVTVDGLRPDAIAAAAAPTLARLAASGAYAPDARAVSTETLPSHLSMATGLLPGRHGVHSNRELARDIDPPTVFTAVRAAGGRSALYFGKAKLTALAPGGSADLLHGPGRGDANWRAGAGRVLAQQFAEAFARERPRLAWVHLREPDMAGHDVGWMSAPYLAAVREADEALAVVLAAIDASPLRDLTTLILTADHGGEGINHSGDHEHDAIVPFICRGPATKRGTRIRGARTVDVAPTALAALGLPAFPDADGRALPECL